MAIRVGESATGTSLPAVPDRDGYDLINELEDYKAQQHALLHILKGAVREQNDAQDAMYHARITLEKSKLKVRTVRDEMRSLEGSMMATAAVLRAIPK